MNIVVQIADFFEQHSIQIRKSLTILKRISFCIGNLFGLFQSLKFDFGDGREIKRTITGNSIHYTLDSNGRLIDFMAGLNAAKLFKDFLHQSKIRNEVTSKLNQSEYSKWLVGYHGRIIENINLDWENELSRIGLGPLSNFTFVSNNQGSSSKVKSKASNSQSPPAIQAMPIAVGKSAFEAPMLESMDGTKGSMNFKPSSPNELTDEQWQMLARFYQQDSRLDQSSIKLIRSEHPNAIEANQVARAKMAAIDPIMKMVMNFQNSIALDTVEK